MEQLIDARLVVHICDGRAFHGALRCIDSDANIVLYDAVQLNPHVMLGSAIIDGRHIARIYKE